MGVSAYAHKIRIALDVFFGDGAQTSWTRAEVYDLLGARTAELAARERKRVIGAFVLGLVGGVLVALGLVKLLLL